MGVNFKRIATMAKQTIDARGGTERLKQDAERLKGIATGPGTAKEKAKAGSDALRQPAPPARGGSTTPGAPRSPGATTPGAPGAPGATTEPHRDATDRPTSR